MQLMPRRCFSGRAIEINSLCCADGRLFLAFLFYGSYFANASAWSELSVTVSPTPRRHSKLICAIFGV